MSEVGDEGTEPCWGRDGDGAAELLRLETGEGSLERALRPASLRSGAPGRTRGITRPGLWGATTGGCRGVEGRPEKGGFVEA